jgi:hypothetical protein
MPEDPELYNQLLREQIELQNSRRIEAALNRQRKADEAQPYSRYIGHDAETNRPLIARLGGTGSIGINRLSNAQPVAGELGRGFDNGFKVRRRRLGGDDPPSPKRGEVTVLARVVRGSKTELWIGGDRKTPLKIKEFNIAPTFVELEKTGPGLNDWLVAWRVGSFGGDGAVIGVISGIEGESWELSEPRAKLLQYHGGGFWASGVLTYSGGFDDEVTTTGGLTLPQVAGMTCYTEIAGFTTIAVAYCEDYAIVGDNPATASSGITRSGFNPAFAETIPLPFSGQNNWEDITEQTAQLVGPVNGPGYMGVANGGCSLSEPDYLSTQNLPTLERSDERRLTRDINTQAYTLSAFGGAVEQQTGNQFYTFQDIRTATRASGGEPKTTVFKRTCTLFDVGPRYQILVDSATFWPNVPASPPTPAPIQFESGLDVQRAIAPGALRNFFHTATGEVDGTGPYTGTEHSPNIVFPAGYSYFEVERSGTVSASQNGLVLPLPPAQTRVMLNFRGTELELQNSLSLAFTYKDLEAEQYPVQTVVSVTSGGDIFDARKYDVTETKGEIVAGKLIWANDSKTTNRFAQSMQRAREGATSAVIVRARYWGRGQRG